MHLRLHGKRPKLPNDPKTVLVAGLNSLQWFAELLPCCLPPPEEFLLVLLGKGSGWVAGRALHCLQLLSWRGRLKV
jgi:hypothetical protein